jgi:hypothetical protein
LLKNFSSLDESTHNDIVHDIFLKLHKSPQTFWNHKSETPPKCFSILAKAAHNRAVDILRRVGKFPEISLDEFVETAQEHEHAQIPSAAEMGKVLRASGEWTEKDEALLKDLCNPDIYPPNKAYPNYEKLAQLQTFQEFVASISFVELKGERQRGSIIYHVEGGEDARECATFVKNLIEKAEPGTEADYNIVASAAGTDEAQDGPPTTDEEAKRISRITVQLPGALRV